jgi:hypothetical protein
MKLIADSEFNFVAQTGHAGWGALVVIACVFLFGYTTLPYVTLVALAAAGLKEFVYDRFFEASEVRGSDLEDFLFYALGIGVSVALVLVKGWVG